MHCPLSPLLKIGRKFLASIGGQCFPVETKKLKSDVEIRGRGASLTIYVNDWCLLTKPKARRL